MLKMLYTEKKSKKNSVYTVQKLVNEIRKAKRVYLAGNGGSASNAGHICNDLETCGIRAYVMNEATKSAWENDFTHEYVFSKWIILHGDPGDLLIALSGSGTSKNILNAVEAARTIGMSVWCEFGAVQGFDMQQAEERQIWLGHQVMRALKEKHESR